MKFVALNYLWIFWLIPLALLFYVWTSIRRQKKTEKNNFSRPLVTYDA